MRMLIHLVLFLALCTPPLPAQVHPRPEHDRSSAAAVYPCAADHATEQLLQNQPDLRQQAEHIDRMLAGRIDEARRTRDRVLPLNGQPLVIPVVVHIVHNNGEENISDDRVYDGIRYLNDTFERLSGATPIRFCMARQDETGRLTNGITRTQSGYTTMILESQDRFLKDLVRWNPQQYLNIWVVREISSSSIGNGVAGYAYYPMSHGRPEDGIVVEARFLGSSQADAAVLIHEVGHYLGLYHTFQGGCGNDDCLLDGDRICDTPPDASTAWVSCLSQPNTCTTDGDDHSPANPFRSVAEGGLGEQNDQIANYMDYNDFACQNLLTPGQMERITAVLTTVRSSLLSSNGCNDPCTADVTVAFTPDRPTAIVGETVTFTNTSAGAHTFRWTLNGTEFATSRDASYTFMAAGAYRIALRGSNDDPNCTKTAYDTIVVTCGARAQIAASATSIQPGEWVTFTNNSTGATSYLWLVNDQPQVGSKNYTHQFNDPGGYIVALIARGPLCSDTAYAFVGVGTCSGKQANIWYFGTRSGLDFSTSPPTALSDGQMDTREGCATVCTREGSLLFYTDGVTVWTMMHEVMEGGNRTLGGNNSSTQSALVVPHPGNSSQYFVFTTDCEENDYRGGLTYALVDMSHNNGLGKVLQPKVQLQASASEKLTAVGHPNGRDFWVISRSMTNTFNAYYVSTTGVSTTPVVSTVDRHYSRDHGIGAMKVAPSGRYIATAIFYLGAVEVFPFDMATGVVSQHGSLTFSGISGAYGVEFSPDGTKLYCSSVYTPYGLTQFDMVHKGPPVFIPSLDRRSLGALQLAPDGMIYVAREGTPAMGLIRNPNEAGIHCNYTDTSVTLPQPARLGLPAYVQTFFTGEFLAIEGPAQVCATGTASYTVGGLPETGTRRWLHRGAAALTFSDDSTQVSLHFHTAGSDTLIALYRSDCSAGADTLVITSHLPPVLSLGPDTALCTGQAILLDAGPDYVLYRWQDGSTSRTLTASAPGVYHVTVTTPSGCTATDSIVVAERSATTLSLGSTMLLCPGGVLTLDAGTGFRNYRWQDGSTDRTLTVFKPGTYWVEAETYCNSILRDTILIAERRLSLTATADTAICPGQSVQLSVSGLLSCRWSPPDGLDDPLSLTPTASPAQTTTYTVLGSDAEGCERKTTVTVSVAASTPLTIDLPEIAAIPGRPVHLPLRLRCSDDLLPLRIARMDATVHYNASLLHLHSTSQGSLEVSRTGAMETVRLTLTDILLTSAETVLTELTGDVFLGDGVAHTTLDIAEITLDGCSPPLPVDGALRLDDEAMCSMSLRHVRLRDMRESVLAVTPNPATEATTIHVTTSEPGRHGVTVYDLQGQVRLRDEFAHDGPRSTHELALPLDALETGLYQVVLHSPSGVVTQRLSVVR